MGRESTFRCSVAFVCLQGPPTSSGAVSVVLMSIVIFSCHNSCPIYISACPNQTANGNHKGCMGGRLCLFSGTIRYAQESVNVEGVTCSCVWGGGGGRRQHLKHVN